MRNRLFIARRVHTMDPDRPVADRVLVSPDGRILAVGCGDDLADWGEYDRDERFADAVLMPGLVEGHAHLMEGAVWQHLYLGHYDRVRPDGGTARGAATPAEVADRLREWAASHPKGAIVAWGFDPLFV